MKRFRAVALVGLIATLLSPILLGSVAHAAGGDRSISFDTGAGSGHVLTGVLSCDGTIVASGRTQGALDWYPEAITGTLHGSSFIFTSTYSTDVPNYPGQVYDGVWNTRYAYTATTTVTGGTYSGSYVVDKDGIWVPWDVGVLSGSITIGEPDGECPGPVGETDDGDDDGDDADPTPQATVNAGEDQTIDATSPDGAPVTYAAPTSDTEGASVICTPASGAVTGAVGSSTVITCSASAPGHDDSEETTFTVSVRCSAAVGFGATIASPLPKASVKLGSTLPVKVRSNTCWTTSPSTIYVKIYDATGTSLIQETPTSTSNADTAGQLRGTDGQYIFNLSTSKLTVGERYTVKLSGGATASSTFSVTK